MAAETPAALRIRALHYQRRDGDHQHTVLHGIDLDVEAGEIVAILGPSGSGKTTLLQLAAGLLDTQTGEIHVGGQRISGRSETERARLRRRHIGFMFQFFNLIPSLTALENCALPLELNGYPADSAQLLEWLRQVGLENRADTPPERLSGGEQQRLALVRALVHRPALVLADEPTGNLDRSTASAASALLFGALRRQGTAALLATHSEELAAQADRCLWLSDGRLRPTAPADR